MSPATTPPRALAPASKTRPSFDTAFLSTISAPQWLAYAVAIPKAWRLVGWKRVVAFIIFVLSCIWTVFLGILHVAPTATANYMMDTAQFDGGEFWQLSESNPLLMGASVTGLSVVAVIYLYLAILVVLPARLRKRRTKRRTLLQQLGRRVGIQLKKIASPALQTRLCQLGDVYYEVVNQHGKYHKTWNVVMEIPEITFQTLMLYGMLSQGLPAHLVYVYVGLMVLNCISCFYHITIAWRQHAFHEMVGDAMLDVVFAVLFPGVILAQAVVDFRGGLRAMAIREFYFPAQSYERRGRLYGNPKQIDIFRTAFESLRITGGFGFVVTIGFNLLTCLRWRRIVATLQHEQRRTRPVGSVSGAAKATPTSIVPLNTSSRIPAAILQPIKEDADKPSPPTASLIVLPHRVVPAFVGLLFLVYGAMVALVATSAISASYEACASLIHCALFAYQWLPGAPSMACPCLVYIEGVLGESFMTHQSLPDASVELSLAAEAGSLRTIQLVNRLTGGKLPPFMERCTGLREVIIVNGDIAELPSHWSSTFQNLQYLQLSADRGGASIAAIPSDFFSAMGSLRTLYLERQFWLAGLPSFKGLGRLETLCIIETNVLTQIPPFEDTPRLHTLALVRNNAIAWLPDLTPVRTSLKYVFIQASPLCCSGFLSTGICNSSYPSCSPSLDGISENSCYPTELDIEDDTRLVIGAQFPLISNGSRAVLHPFLDSDSACNKSAEPIVKGPLVRGFSSAPDVCDGVWYRACGDSGICYSFDSAHPQCLVSSTVIDMRKAEIQSGASCKRVEEAWLGCAQR